MRKTMIACTAALFLAGCQDTSASSAAPEVFRYDLTRTSSFDLESHDASGPLAGAIVSVRAAAVAPAPAGELLWMGLTGQDGHARASFRTDRGGGAPLDIVINKAGFKGPYTDESLRDAAGIFAPSARLSVPVDQVGAISVTMEKGS